VSTVLVSTNADDASKSRTPYFVYIVRNIVYIASHSLVGLLGICTGNGSAYDE
jgi:hypothetical protein